MALLTEGFRNS